MISLFFEQLVFEMTFFKILLTIIYIVCFQKYYHGESISVNAVIDNNSNKMVKKIKVSGLGLISEVCCG